MAAVSCVFLWVHGGWPGRVRNMVGIQGFGGRSDRVDFERIR